MIDFKPYMYINITCNNVHVMLFPTFAEAQALLRSAKVGPSCPAPLEPDAREMKQLAATCGLLAMKLLLRFTRSACQIDAQFG